MRATRGNASFVGTGGDVAVLTPLNSLGDNGTITAFDTAMKEAIGAGARAIILDMRETPSGGNTENLEQIQLVGGCHHRDLSGV